MKQFIALFILGLGLFSQSLHAADKKDNTSSFWETLRGKIESLTPQKKLGVTTATGGVRGAPVSTEDMYWKNDASAQVINADELDAFAKAAKLADSEDKTQAKAAFAEFIKKFPESSLRKDADQALALLQNQPAPAK
jgi:TolA-binding protein